MERYVLFHVYAEENTWFLTDLRYYERPDVPWILHFGSGRQIEDAMVFTNKEKAEKIVAILSNQLDDNDLGEQWFIKEIK